MRLSPALLAWGFLLIACTTARAENHIVIVGGGSYGGYPSLMFEPAQLTIAVGDTVTFENAGGPHNVHADDESFRCADGCDGVDGGSGNPSSASWTSTVAFDHPGTVGYHCDNHAHAGMVGSINVQGATPSGPPINQQGLTGAWEDLQTLGQGFVLEVFPDFNSAGSGLLFGGWFTYDGTAPAGRLWYTIQGDVAESATATVPIYRTEGGVFDAGDATTTEQVGSATLSFSDCSTGVLAYAFSDGSGRSGSIPLTRALANVRCGANGDNGATARNYLLSGTWSDHTDPGQGVLLEINPIQGVLFGAWFTYAPRGADDRGNDPQWYTLQATISADATDFDVTLYETSGGVFDQANPTTTIAVGSGHLAFSTCSAATLDYRFTSGVNTGLAGTLDLTRTGAAPVDCAL